MSYNNRSDCKYLERSIVVLNGNFCLLDIKVPCSFSGEKLFSCSE